MERNVKKQYYKKLLTKIVLIYIIIKANEKFMNSGGGIMKRTFQPNNRKRSKKMGFLARINTKMISSRRRKGRKVLAH